MDLVVGDIGTVASGENTNKLHVLFNNGVGLFNDTLSLTGESGPQNPIIGDLNRDGHNDIIVSNGPSDTVSIFYSTGDGNFASGQHTAAGDLPYALALIDYSPHALPYIAVANRDDNTLDVLGVVSDNHIRFTPQPDQSGTATITVTVEDAGLDNDLATTADNATFSRTFDVIVNPVNDPPTLDPLDDLEIDEDAPLQTVQLAGISSGPLESESLRITASSDNTSVIPDPSVTYTSGESTGSLSFTPVANQSGTATITVCLLYTSPSPRDS